MINVFPNGFDVDVKRVEKIVGLTLKQHGIRGKYEANVNFVSEEEMLKLHDKKTHDVLSFPLDKEMGPDGITRLGDIVVLGGLPAGRQGDLIVHSCLHLLGIHHE